MGYALENIESCFAAFLSGNEPSNAANLDFQRIRIECQRIKRAFQRVALKPGDEKSIQRFFAIHQRALVDLLDLIDNQYAAYSQQSPLVEARGEVVGVLDFVQDTLPEYFDSNTRLPTLFVEKYRLDEDMVIEYLRELSLTREEVRDLSNLIIFDLTESSNCRRITFRKWHYIRMLFGKLATEKSHSDSELAKQTLLNVLMEVNFNTRRFFLFYTGYIARSC